MTNRADEFYERIKAVDHFKGHVYHATTCSRISEASYCLTQLTTVVTSTSHGELSPSTLRDLYVFAFVGTLRSSLDSLAHELLIFFNGTAPNPRNVDFGNLLDPKKIQLTLPPELAEHVRTFQASSSYVYLHALRNTMLHRNLTVMRVESSFPISIAVRGADGVVGTADWDSGYCEPTPLNLASPLAQPLPDPPMYLPDDPSVALGDESYELSRPILSTSRRLLNDTKNFLLTAFELAR